MTELKTLKDLREFEVPLYNEDFTEVDGIDYQVRVSELKAEAVKWVKEDRKEIDGELYNEIEKRWMKRLDITEEDLK